MPKTAKTEKVTKTTKKEKLPVDEQVAKFFYNLKRFNDAMTEHEKYLNAVTYGKTQRKQGLEYSNDTSKADKYIALGEKGVTEKLAIAVEAFENLKLILKA